MYFPILHIHQRQRITQQHQKYPHPNPKIRMLDNVVLILSFILPLTLLPQTYNIFVLDNTSGVSFPTWFMMLILIVPFFIYGLVHKVKPMIFNYGISLVILTVIVVGLLVK